MRCTWKDCRAAEAEHPQLAADGEEWSRLCRDHNDELEAAIASGDVKKLMRAYILAQGGAAAAARRMTG